MESRVTQITVAPEGEPIFSEGATTFTIDDEDAGEFLVIEQTMDGYGKIAIDKQEWPSFKEAIESMISKCRD